MIQPSCPSSGPLASVLCEPRSPQSLIAIDIDKDGDLDLVCPDKSGLDLCENLGRGR